MNLVDIGGAKIAWKASGSPEAPTLMLWHSLGSDSSMWDPQVERFQDDYRVILADTLGHGRSDAPAGGYTIDRLCNAMLAVADAAEADRFHLCGISLGGQMALWTALNRPDRLRSVIACNTATRIGNPSSWRERLEQVRSGGMESVREAVVGNMWFAPGFADRHPDWYAKANQVFARTPPLGYIGCCQALAATDLGESVSKIAVPTLVIGGALDASTPPDAARALHRLIPDSELTIFDDAAHFSNLDCPEAFNDRVTRFVAAVEST